jgi:FkbM family methyltransferase
VKKFDAWWLPDGDTHFAEAMRAQNRVVDGRLSYQYDKLDAAVRAQKPRQTALDCGAHCGLWSYFLAQKYKRVIGFEPVTEHAECFRLNAPRAELIQCALGAEHGYVHIETDAENSGKAHIAGAGDVEMIALDSLRLNNVDLIKIDVEGAEPQVIKGAVETIERCRPVIVFEDKGFHERSGNKRNAALIALLSMGMRIRAMIGRDYVMDWKT